MAAAARRLLLDDVQQGFVSPDTEIRAFLHGGTNGESVLHALYDHVLEEPIPEAMRAILRR